MLVFYADTVYEVLLRKSEQLTKHQVFIIFKSASWWGRKRFSSSQTNANRLHHFVRLRFNN